MKGMIDALIGAQWGDEGKGRIVDSIGADIDIFARYQGGANAGHTVIVDGEKYVFHLLPSGMLYPGKACVIGNGVVIDPEALMKELDDLNQRDMNRARLLISRSAHVVMPYHKKLDQLQEQSREQDRAKIGTTGRGIGPCYVDKYSRCGIRVEDLLDSQVLRDKLTLALGEKNFLFSRLYDQHPLPFADVFEQALEWGRQLQPYVADVSLVVDEALQKGQRVLLEGAQGTLLDIDHGTYPMVTSSSPVASSGCGGLGVSAGYLNRVIGCTKAYMSRVGEGPFPTEDHGVDGETLRETGHEYGVTTGRPRRCGWLDFVALRYAVRVNGLTCLALTKLDVLSQFSEIKVCHSYKVKGQTVEHFPSAIWQFDDIEPNYTVVSGWKKDISNARRFEDLPQQAQDYVHLVEKVAGIPVGLIGVGPERDQMILRGL